jgi:GGDEF domain-containing protein
VNDTAVMTHPTPTQALTTQWTGADADAQAQASRYVTGASTRDALSILPSAARFRRQFAQRLAACAERQRPLAVLALECLAADARHMPDVNGTDLAAVAARRSAFAMRLVRSFHRGALLTHVGADTFVAVLEDLPPQPELGLRVAALLRAIAEPLYVEVRELTPHVRLGIALLPGDGRTGDELCRRARAALARAASTGTQVTWFAGLDE